MPRGQFMRNLSVLVVDSHRFMQQVMRVMLSELGVRDINSALSVDEALRDMSCRKIDIVIADYKIGGQSGAEFIRLTRTQHADGVQYVPIIACTGDTTASRCPCALLPAA
jgi:DNA-binding NarL/FixJ family response regulator